MLCVATTGKRESSSSVVTPGLSLYKNCLLQVRKSEEVGSPNPKDHLVAGSVNFFWKRPDGNQFVFCEPYILSLQFDSALVIAAPDDI